MGKTGARERASELGVERERERERERARKSEEREREREEREIERGGESERAHTHEEVREQSNGCTVLVFRGRVGGEV